MRSVSRSILGLSFFFPLTASAHEKWFIDPARQGMIPALFRELSTQVILVATIAVLMLAGCVFLDRTVRRLRDTRKAANRFRKLYPWAPTVLGITTGLALAWFALDRAILAPNITVPDSTAGTIFIILELIAAATLVLGLFSRIGAVIIIVLLVASFVWHPFRDAIDQIHFLGIAVFIFSWGRGKYSLGSVFSRLVASAPSHLRPSATLALRIFLGLDILILAALKILRPDLHLELMMQFPWNPYSIAHSIIPSFTANLYLLIITAIEALAGLIVLFGILLRPTALFLAVIFVAGAIFVPPADLIGHLPYVGATLALAILGRSGERGEGSVSR